MKKYYNLGRRFCNLDDGAISEKTRILAATMAEIRIERSGKFKANRLRMLIEWLAQGNTPKAAFRWAKRGKEAMIAAQKEAEKTAAEWTNFYDGVRLWPNINLDQARAVYKRAELSKHGVPAPRNWPDDKLKSWAKEHFKWIKIYKA